MTSRGNAPPGPGVLWIMNSETTRTRRFVDALKRMQRRNDEEWIRRIESSRHQHHLLHGRRFS